MTTLYFQRRAKYSKGLKYLLDILLIEKELSEIRFLCYDFIFKLAMRQENKFSHISIIRCDIFVIYELLPFLIRGDVFNRERFGDE